MYRLMIGWMIGHFGTILLALIMKPISRRIEFISDSLFQTFDLTDHVLKVVSWQTVSLIGCFFAPFLFRDLQGFVLQLFFEVANN